MVKNIFSSLLFLLFAMSAFSQDSIATKKIKILPVPTFGYSPETRTYVGAVSLFALSFYNDSNTRKSNIGLEVSYTWNKQFIIESDWNYFFKDEKWLTKGMVHFSKYPDQYYGIGANTPEENKIIYNSNRFQFEGYTLRKIKDKLFAGPGLKYIEYWNVEPVGLAEAFPELVNGYSFGVGFSLLKDSRNNLITPTKGIFLNINPVYNFSKNNYTDIILDARYYKTWKDKFTLATRFMNNLRFGKAPFYNLAYMGGDQFVRGFYYGRYRDDNLSTLQTEFRLPLVWRFGLATFGGVSNLYSSKNRFSSETTKVNYGMGLRFMIDRKERTNLRFDYARGSGNNSGFYVAFGESF